MSYHISLEMFPTRKVVLNSEGSSETSSSSRSSLRGALRGKLHTCSACKEFAQFTPTLFVKKEKKKKKRKAKLRKRKNGEVEDIQKLTIVGEAKYAAKVVK